MTPIVPPALELDDTVNGAGGGGGFELKDTGPKESTAAHLQCTEKVGFVGGKFSNAGAFNGTDNESYCSRAHSELSGTALLFAANESFTVSMWWNSSGRSAHGSWLSQQGTQMPHRGVSLGISSTDNKLSLIMAHEQGSPPIYDWVKAKAATPGDDGWHHAVMIYGGAVLNNSPENDVVKITMYVDGVTVEIDMLGDQLEPMDDVVATDVAFVLGRVGTTSVGAASAYTGLLDDVAHWKGIELDETQITAIYKSTGPLSQLW